MIKGTGYEITAQNLKQHELIGLSVLVKESTDPKRKGTKGVVVDETQNTFVLKGHAGKEKVEGEKIVVPKAECVFEFDLKGEKVVFDGKELLKRPEDRIKN